MDNDSKTAQTLLYLLSCAVNAEECKLKPDEIDFDGLYSLAAKHGLSSVVAFALESAGISERRFVQAKLKTKRRLGLLDIERENIYKKMSEAGIWYAPLKGIVLKDFYPRYGMREMTDNDILCDGSKMPEIKEIMESLGFTCEHYGAWHHDTYNKPPAIVFEMHHSLFLTGDMPLFDSYFADAFDRLAHKEGCEYAFSDEDFYIYILAHEYKHFSHNGTGLRSLLDLYVYLNTHPKLDFDYIGRELEKLSLSDFERQSRDVVKKLFSLQQLSEEDAEFLSLFLGSSLYGSASQGTYNFLTQQLDGKDTKSAKIKYFFDRIFVHGEALERHYPFFAEHKWLLPALYVYRPIKTLFTNPKSITRETKSIVKYESPKNRW